MKKIIAIGLIGVTLATSATTANAKEWSLLMLYKTTSACRKAV